MVNLDGEALYFAEDLEDNVTRDWNLLKKALLKQFGTPPSQRSIPSGIDDRRLDDDDSASVSTKVDSPPEASTTEEHSEPQNQVSSHCHNALAFSLITSDVRAMCKTSTLRMLLIDPFYCLCFADIP